MRRCASRCWTAACASQPLLLPAVVDLPPADAVPPAGARRRTGPAGLEIEAFGPGAVMVRALPAALGSPEPGPLLRDLADELEELDEATALNARLDAVIARLACHGSIRAGRRLNGPRWTRCCARWRRHRAPPRAATGGRPSSSCRRPRSRSCSAGGKQGSPRRHRGTKCKPKVFEGFMRTCCETEDRRRNVTGCIGMRRRQLGTARPPAALNEEHMAAELKELVIGIVLRRAVDLRSMIGEHFLRLVPSGVAGSPSKSLNRTTSISERRGSTAVSEDLAAYRQIHDGR